MVKKMDMVRWSEHIGKSEIEINILEYNKLQVPKTVPGT